MARYTGPIVKQARREGAPVDGSSKTLKYLQKKGYAPGEHGNKASFGKKSEYSRQLREKQKAKRIYGVLEKQFRKYYEMADKKEGITGTTMLELLERRLDNVIYRAGLASTRRQARQIVSHGLTTLNGKRVKTPSILVKLNDKVEIREKSKSSPLFAETTKAKDESPKWLNVDLKKLSAEITSLPDDQDVEQSIQSQLIVEFYSK